MRSIRKYGQYYCPIARPIFFWLNGRGGKFACRRTSSSVLGGCVHRFARATCRPGGDQGADGARLPQAGGCRKSARILPGSNRALGRRSARFRTPGRCGWDPLEAKLACRNGRKIGNEKRPARNQPRFKAEWRWVCRMPGVTERLVVSSPSVCEVWAHRLLRQFSEPACVQACGDNRASDHCQLRAG